MKQVREQSLRLRLQGHSYNEINRKIGVPKSTLSGWFSDLVLSQKAQARLNERKSIGTEVLIKRNKMQTHHARQRMYATQNKAASEIGSLTKKELLLLGTALYWAEGYKRLRVINGKERTHHTISFLNTDPEMIFLFIRFLREILSIPISSIRTRMRLYPHINEKESLRYWMDVTKLPSDNFRKAIFLISKASQSKRPYNRLPHGTLQIEVADTQKFHSIMGWIRGIKKVSTMIK